MPNNDNEKTRSAPKKPFNLKIIGLLLLVLLAVILVWHNKLSDGNCSENYRQDTLIQVPSGQQIAVEIAESTASQIKGLSDRACIGDEWGMLFSFSNETYRDFWMKDMNFPIDIVWMNEDKKVVDVTKNAKPDSYPKTFSSSSPAQYVLELSAGNADELGLEPFAHVNF
jgi:hypothetical protein